ncbi:HlyD family efflux transporter periplasmic adaptor subunit [Methylobacterium sp. R2-1]|uniref:HlyD family efflux transporter periplasmic adaptor subunit n=1 Tax=Methylobacterium sp. R2-1 TaxID=2587064 RepID=UPI001617B2A2|nr:HlyD family efflux transporter periplasmic adaptor subunit [Methylobacterium sp. R2-1]MBB2961430.1 multidrug resistance efflux pump [Methylobacterium sp. R2-1]
MSQPTLTSAAEHRHGRLIRVSSVSLASVLAILIGTSVLPPLVADQSDRAVVNAPVTLLTAPIAGDIGDIPVAAGDSVERGSLVAQITNDRLDRATAIQLAGRVSELRERALAAENKRTSNEAYLAALDRAIRDQSAQMTQVLRAQVEELKAKIASASASGEEKRVLMERQVGMVARDVASPDMVKSTTQAFNAATQEKKAAEAKLNQKTVQLDGLARGLFLGDELRSLADLSQKQLSITYDTQRLAIEEKELKAAMVDQQALLTRENQRLDRLTTSEIKASAKGVVYNVNATTGRHVGAGDRLVSVVDCERSFVVAIFSYRQGQNLQVGSVVTISGGSVRDRRGVVTEILPKTSDTVDATYAVPFPQTERRELYVLVKPEPLPASAAASESPVEAACGVGRWVTVTRASGWVPSTSVVWRDLGDGASGLITKVAAAAPDFAQTVAGQARAMVSSASNVLKQVVSAGTDVAVPAQAGHEVQVRPDTGNPPASAAFGRDRSETQSVANAPDLSVEGPADASSASGEKAATDRMAPIPTQPLSAGKQPAEFTSDRRISMPPLPPARPNSFQSEAPRQTGRTAQEARS